MSLLQDVRYGLRILRTNPGFSAIAMVALALGAADARDRIAHSAGARRDRAMVLRQGMGLEPAGVAVAVSAALGLARAMSSLLFGVQANDPLAFAGVSLVLLAFAFVAGYVPARRAVKVDPMVALRYE